MSNDKIEGQINIACCLGTRFAIGPRLILSFLLFVDGNGGSVNGDSKLDEGSKADRKRHSLLRVTFPLSLAE